ncbi:MAG: hypothetical protein KA354_14545 [Phycisphaerae bacterium]|nr:hypothetical protein [Phycisphaerae bacterium]
MQVDVEVEAVRVEASARLAEVCLRFGVPLAGRARRVARGVELGLRPGTITLVLGPSGAGKTRLLRAVERQCPKARWVNTLPFPLDVSVLDAVAPARPLHEALGILTACGLGEPMLWVRSFDQLSEGEKFRARLARSLSLQHRNEEVGPLLCDEFGAVLHDRVAHGMAFSLRKLVDRRKLTLYVATCRNDLEEDLQPDCVVRMGAREAISGQESTISEDTEAISKRSFSLLPRLKIEAGMVRDYEPFAAWHYRGGESLGFVDKVFVLREGGVGAGLGVVVYGRPVLELALRNQVTGGRFSGRPERLNAEVRVLKRLVIHPDVRGCGLGHWLVRKTLPLVGTPCVECLAAMGAVNPVFEKAGMTRVGTVALPPAQERVLAELRTEGVDPWAADFVVRMCQRPAARQRVADSIVTWYRGMTRSGRQRVARLTPSTLAQVFRQIAGSRPVYFWWQSQEEPVSGR